MLNVNSKKNVSPEVLFPIIQTEKRDKNILVSKSILQIISSTKLSSIQAESRFVYSLMELLNTLERTIEIEKYYDLFHSSKNQFDYSKINQENNLLAFEKIFYFISVKEKMSYPYFLEKISDSLKDQQIQYLDEFYQLSVELQKRSEGFIREKAESSMLLLSNSIEENDKDLSAGH